MAPRISFKRAAAALLSPCLLTATALASPQDDALDVAALQARLAALETEIEAERQATEQERVAHDAELERTRTRHRALAGEVLDLQIETQSLDADRAALRTQESTVREEARELQTFANAILANTRNLAEQLKIHLSQVPGHDDDRDELSKLARPEADTAWSAALRDRPAEVLAILDRTLEEACVLAVRDREIWAASGRKEAVRLLSAGHVAWAYELGERRGLALSSPADASGFRWSEDLPDDVHEQLGAAFEEAARGGRTHLPMDVSGRIRVDHGLEDESFFTRLKAGGPVMVPLFLVALLALVMITERAYVLFLRNRPDPSRVEQILSACRADRHDDAIELADAGRGAVPRTLAATLRRRDAPAAVLEDSVQEHLLHELPILERFLGGIASLAAVAPLLGLLGTVTGIINTFAVMRSYGNANPSLMATGISEALVTTATGMAIAIPILLLHVLLRGRADRTIRDAERHAAAILNILSEDPAPSEEAAA